MNFWNCYAEEILKITGENTNQKNFYKRSDGAIFNGVARIDVNPSSTAVLESPVGSFFIAGIFGNNYAGCAYLVLSSWTGIHNITVLYEGKNISCTFENCNDSNENKIRATIKTQEVSGKVPFCIYALA